MGHKVTVEKIDWDGIANELESIEKPKNPKSNRVYVIGAAFIGILLLFTSLNIMILAQTPSGFPTVIEPGSMNAPASFIIFQESGICYLKSGVTGEILSSNSNAETIISLALVELNNESGLIHIKNGIYTDVNLEVDLASNKSITLEGEGYNTMIIGRTYGTTPTLKFDMEHVAPDNTRPWSILVRNMLIAANSLVADNSTALEFVDCARAYGENLWLAYSNNGLSIRGGVENAFREIYCVFNIVGVHITLNPAGSIATTVAFYSCSFRQNHVGVFLDYGAGVTFYSCVFESNSDIGLDIYGVSGAHGIYSCWFENNGWDSGTYYDISDRTLPSPYDGRNFMDNCAFTGAFFGNNSWWLITGGAVLNSTNIVFGPSVPGWAGLFGPGANITWVNVIGYVTQSKGLIAITGAFSTVTVNHNLSATPTIVIVTCNNTGAGNYSVSSITSTQFVISFTNQPGADEWRFYWYAEV